MGGCDDFWPAYEVPNCDGCRYFVFVNGQLGECHHTAIWGDVDSYNFCENWRTG